MFNFVWTWKHFSKLHKSAWWWCWYIYLLNFEACFARFTSEGRSEVTNQLLEPLHFVQCCAQEQVFFSGLWQKNIVASALRLDDRMNIWWNARNHSILMHFTMMLTQVMYPVFRGAVWLQRERNLSVSGFSMLRQNSPEN